MNVAAHLVRAARAQADVVAIFEGKRRTTYGALDERTNKLARRLLDLGVSRGDRVVLALPNCTEWIEADLAIAKAGAMTVPLGMRLHETEMRRVVEVSGARHIITDVSTLPVFVEAGESDARQILVLGLGHSTDRHFDYHEALESARSDAVCVDVDEERDGRVLRFTSGTTGKPKGVFLSHANWLGIAHSMLLDRCPLRSDDIVLACGPYAHAGGLWIVPVIMRRATIQVIDAFDPRAVMDHIRAGRATVLQVVPTGLRRILDLPGGSRADWENIRTVTYSGAPIDAATLRDAIERIGPKLVQSYGLNEAAGVTVLQAAEHERFVGYSDWKQPLGRETTLTEVIIVDSQGSPVSPGEAGELGIKGPMVFREYWNDPEATAAAKRNGWFFTGDLAVRGEDGFLYMAGRSKEIIITGGFNVSPEEVEGVLRQHPVVRQVAVVGLPHREWGEQVTAFVVVREGRVTAEAEFLEFCRARLTSYKRPKAVHFVDDIPVNANGKVQRRSIVEAHQGAPARSGSEAG